MTSRYLDENLWQVILDNLTNKQLQELYDKVPVYRSIIDVVMAHRRIREITWLDEETFKLLSRCGNNTLISSNPKRMIAYHSARKEFVVPERPAELRGILRIVILSHTFCFVDKFYRHAIHELAREIPNLCYYFREKLRDINFNRTCIPDEFIEFSKMKTASILDIEDQRRMHKLFLSIVSKNDVLLYFIDKSKSPLEVLTYLKEALTPSHILIIAKTRRPSDKEGNNTRHLNEILMLSEEFIEKELKNSQIQWRLWYVDRNSRGKLRYHEMLEWFSDKWNGK